VLPDARVSVKPSAAHFSMTASYKFV